MLQQAHGRLLVVFLTRVLITIKATERIQVQFQGHSGVHLASRCKSFGKDFNVLSSIADVQTKQRVHLIG